MTHPRFDGGIGPIPWTPRTDELGQPAVQQAEYLPADGVIAAAVVVDSHPGVMLTFGLGPKRYPPILLLHLDGLPELIAQAVEQARSQDGFTSTEPAEPPTCLGCGRRLFGDRALLGVCTACQDEHAGDGDSS